MPYVKRYAESSEKDGFYVSVNPGNGPINIRSRPVLDTIFEKLDFGEKTSISHNLCWALYDAGLLFTRNSLPTDNTTTGNSPGYNLGELDLDATTRDELVRLLQKYASNDYVDDFTNLLEDADSVDVSTVSSNGSDTDTDTSDTEFLKEITNSFSTLSQSFDSEVAAQLDNWDTSYRSSQEGSISPDELMDDEVAVLDASVSRVMEIDFDPEGIRVDADKGVVRYTFNLEDQSFGRHDGHGDDLLVVSLDDWHDTDDNALDAVLGAIGESPNGDLLTVERTYGTLGSVLESLVEPDVRPLLQDADSEIVRRIRRRILVFQNVLDTFHNDFREAQGWNTLFQTEFTE